VTDSISGRLLRLPFFTSLSDTEAERVVDRFLTSLGAPARVAGNTTRR
jgi:hypothetical protein